ncbi:sugar transferase [Flavobacterium aquicola]|uniref:Lipopolysaccharide/colanic/teichoic acid biosynthesis glycosyltransferase n=1 Tax=Flavobacterium aquicola TaxID=1682742 RepID=A0A3E0EM88_9FLAO|nr:sugar transferase [Flavobacterium aquicola]REG98256.1 lipopolysaccharide/colanic/teichoic acid biosynthesis glycosyltransferase [Flavobacterium aquicola]
MQSIIKRLFDILFSSIFLLFFFWVIIIAWFVAVIDTRTNGVFIQERIGQYGKRFKIYKLRTFQVGRKFDELQISKFGQLLRNYKLDELPQLFNVMKGEMSIVGPRPDIAGYYDLLEGENRKILELKPGLTSLASLKYYSEDKLLDNQVNPLGYNDNVLFPDKIKMNLEYYYHKTFFIDLEIIVNTLKIIFKRSKS